MHSFSTKNRILDFRPLLFLPSSLTYLVFFLLLTTGKFVSSLLKYCASMMRCPNDKNTDNCLSLFSISGVSVVQIQVNSMVTVLALMTSPACNSIVTLMFTKKSLVGPKSSVPILPNRSVTLYQLMTGRLSPRPKIEGAVI